MADQPSAPSEQPIPAGSDHRENMGNGEAPAPAPQDTQPAQAAKPRWRETASKFNQGLETFANTITNFQTILTLVGAVFGAMAFLNLELGLLASLNTLFHSIAGFVYRAKIFLILGLLAVVIANLAWLIRHRGAGNRSGRRRWLPMAVALLLAIGIWLVKPVPYDLAILTYTPAAGTQPASSQDSLSTQLATLLAEQMQARNEMVEAVLASQADRSEAALQAVGEEKGVDFVVSGTYALAGPNLQLKTTLYDVRAAKFLLDQPVEQFDLRDNAAAMQEETASQLLAALPLYSGVRAAEAQKDAQSCAGAYECYLRGRQYYRWYSSEGYEQAIAAYDKALEDEPDYALAYAGLADAQTFLAADLTYVGDYDRSSDLLVQAAHSARRALELEPESLESLRAAAFLYVVRNFNEQAAALVSRIEKLAPDDAETHWLRGLVAPTADEQLEQFQAAVDLAPNLTIARQFLGNQLWEMGRPEEALPHLQTAIQQNPYLLRAYETLGWTYLSLDKPLDAEAQARLALQIEPRYTAARMLLSFALAAQGSTVEATSLAQETTAEAPEQSLYDSALGYARQSDYTPIITFFESLRNQQPDFVYVYNHLGNLYRSAGRIDEAETSYREALRRDPGLAAARLNLAELLAVERGDLAAAETEAAKAATQLPNLSAAHGLHGDILRQLKRFDEAEAALRTAQTLNAKSPWPHFALAALYLDMGQIEQAEAEFEQGKAVEPEEAYSYNAFANLLFERGQYGKAATYYQEAIKRSPDNSLLYSNLADAQRNTGDLAAALQSCQQAIDLAPETNADAYLICGQILYSQGDSSAAEDMARRGLAAVPTSYGLHLLLGKVLDEAGRYPEADAEFEAAVELDTRSITALNEWANALDARSEVEAAAARYEEATQRYPNDPILLTNLADSYRQLGRLDDARSLVQAALDIQPDLAWAHNVWGDLLADQERYEEALSHYRAAVALQADQAIYVRDLARVYVELGQITQAETAYAQAAAIDPADGITFNDWGLLLTDQERYDEAIAKYEEALRLRPTDAVIWTNLGDVYWQLGDYERAARQYEQAVAADPQDDYALASLGLALSFLGQPAEAVDNLGAAVAINPNVLWYLTALAQAQIDAGDLESAAETLDQAAALAPDDPEVRALQQILAEQSAP